MSTVVYTSIFGGYDVLLPPRRKNGLRFVVISPEKPYQGSGWEWIQPPPSVRSFPPSLANRWCKIFAHRVFPDATLTAYVDANIHIRGDLRPLLAAFLDSDAELGLFKHGERTTVTDEAEACFRWEKLPSEFRPVVSSMLLHQREAGMPSDMQLTENGVVLRRHDGVNLPQAMEMWWTYTQVVPRDQLSLPFVRYASGISCQIFDWNYRNSNRYFTVIQGHQRQRGPLLDLTFILNRCDLDAKLRWRMRVQRDAYRLMRRLCSPFHFGW